MSITRAEFAVLQLYGICNQIGHWLSDYGQEFDRDCCSDDARHELSRLMRTIAQRHGVVLFDSSQAESQVPPAAAPPLVRLGPGGDFIADITSQDVLGGPPCI